MAVKNFQIMMAFFATFFMSRGRKIFAEFCDILLIRRSIGRIFPKIL
jgi:hypothetical protein